MKEQYGSRNVLWNFCCATVLKATLDPRISDTITASSKLSDEVNFFLSFPTKVVAAASDALPKSAAQVTLSLLARNAANTAAALLVTPLRTTLPLCSLKLQSKTV